MTWTMSELTQQPMPAAAEVGEDAEAGVEAAAEAVAAEAAEGATAETKTT